MKVRFLGTAAGECVPGVFCGCKTCAQARKLGGKNIRSRTQVMIDSDILIDLPPDTFMHVAQNGLDLSKLEHLLITHSHGDHFLPSELGLRGYWFALDLGGSLKIHSNSYVAGLIKKATENGFAKEVTDGLEIKPVEVYDKLNCGGYEVTPLPALHSEGEVPLIYLISKDNKTYFHGTDTGPLKEEVYDYLVKNGIKLDLVMLDCTHYKSTRNFDYHMTFSDNITVKEKLIRLGVCDSKTVFVCSHFSHNDVMMHDEMVEHCAKSDFTVAYDGLEIEIKKLL